MSLESLEYTIKSVMLGHAVADALGVPVEFSSREKLDAAPVREMRGFGTYPYPAGCWSDDTSMSLATLDSLCSGRIDWDDIMTKFGEWYHQDAYTPTGELFDVGNTCSIAIENYTHLHIPPLDCGPSDDYSNGNGSLMRIHPLVLFAHSQMLPLMQWEQFIMDGSALTHGHERSKLGCGIYAYLLMHLIAEPNKAVVWTALRRAEAHYRDNPEIKHYARLLTYDVENLTREDIKSSGYVVDTLEAAVWCLLKTNTYRDCVLMAVNLGEDTDTVAAVAGGLAGALYGYDAIPEEWVKVLKKREYIEGMCTEAARAWLQNE